MTRSYKKSYTRRSSKRFHVTFDYPADVDLSPADKIRAAIKKDTDLIAEYPNYSTLCDEARARIAANQIKLDEILASQCPWTSYTPSPIELSRRSYKGRHVPDHFCPRDNLPLIVNEKEFKTTDPDAPYYERRLVCSGFFTIGCSYKEPWSDEIQEILNQPIEIDVDF